jgi:hypothetical protein
MSLFKVFSSNCDCSPKGVRIGSLVAFIVGAGITLAVANQSLSKLVLFFVYFIIPMAMVIIYVTSQVMLVYKVALNRMWPLGSLTLAVASVCMAQLFVFVFSTDVCLATKHYFDGLVFASAFHLFAVMMVYKYWDVMTEEDLEFSFSSANSWKVVDSPNLASPRNSVISSTPSYSSSQGTPYNNPDAIYPA